MLTESSRRIALGNWGERKAISLLQKSGFLNARDANQETHNHPFGDVYAERGGIRYLIGVKTRCKYQNSGPLNSTYNIAKRRMDIQILARRYDAELAWLSLQVVPEIQVYWAYFGTVSSIQEDGQRFSIRMSPKYTLNYECLAELELDKTIRPEWTNGGYAKASE